MAVLHRALCTWFVCLIFLILLVLRLDERTRWSWYIVFIPMWLYDLILTIYLVFEMVTYCKAGRAATRIMRRTAWYLTCAMLVVATQVMVCIKLENLNTSMDIPLYYIMIPVWIVLPVTIVDLFVNNLTSIHAC
jgi:hypothetical protein